MMRDSSYPMPIMFHWEIFHTQISGRLYMPGQFVSIGILFKLFNPSVLVERWWDITMRSIILTGIFFFLMRKLNPSISLFAWLFSTILLSGARFGSTIYPALVWALFSILMIDQFYRSGKYYWILAAGLSVGFTFWYRWDFGVYAWIGIFISLLLFHMHFQIKSNQSANQANRKIIIFTAGVIITIIPLFFINLRTRWIGKIY